MIFGLLVVVIFTLVLPLGVNIVEHHLEIFLFIMGISATIISGVYSGDLMHQVLRNQYACMITTVVFVVGFLFACFKNRIRGAVESLLKYVPLKLFVCIMVILLGLCSSLITAIIASLVMAEIVGVLPIGRRGKILLCVLSCYAIGIGAALTPTGEPLSAIVVSKLNKGFTFMLQLVGVYAIVGIVLLGLLAALFINHESESEARRTSLYYEKESLLDVAIRSAKVFIFVIALTLLGTGLKPIIDLYIIPLTGRILYFVNIISAVLDNATLAAAEISPKMALPQIKAILISLLVSGGMLIQGNIPNIIAAGKLNIKSSEWAKVAVPLGTVMLAGYYITLFIL